MSNTFTIFTVKDKEGAGEQMLLVECDWEQKAMRLWKLISEKEWPKG